MARLARNAPRCRPRRSRLAGPIRRNKSYTPHCSRRLLITRVNQRGLRVYRGERHPAAAASDFRMCNPDPARVSSYRDRNRRREQPYLIQATCNLRWNEVIGAVECLAMAPFSCKLISRRSTPIGFHFNGINESAP